ncbi:MAG TPA: TetR family transcriptional regulator [Usitatibacter sp.]|nr:TetR family transcriptional regulator [Usitatibacter sp.]
MRRTKEDAALTRAAIVEGALACFDRHGISGSTLEQIAREAGVTKGAIYHHFAGKGALFREIREQVSVPLLDHADTTLLRPGCGLPALERIERFLAGLLESIERDAVKRRALTVLSFKCEYVDDMATQLRGSARNNERLLRAFEAAYREARRKGEMPAGIVPRVAALETLMFLVGMVRLWLMHAPGHALRKGARATIRAHVDARRR